MNANQGKIDTCLNCGGAIIPPNIYVGYAGPVCYCQKDPSKQYQRPASQEREKTQWVGDPQMAPFNSVPYKPESKATAFKDYVHKRLDDAGVPHDPDPEKNKAHGCRIEGRLNFLLVQRSEASQKLEVARVALSQIANEDYRGNRPNVCLIAERALVEINK